MLRFILRSLLVLVAIFAVMALHISLLFFLPPPFNKINFIMVVLILWLLATDSGGVVWLAAALYFCLELYTVTPFGIVLAAGTISLLILVWLYRSFFTNRGVLSAAVLTAVGLILYRVFYSIGILFFDRAWDWGPLLTVYGIELLMTVPTVTILYAIASRFIKQLSVTKLSR